VAGVFDWVTRIWSLRRGTSWSGPNSRKKKIQEGRNSVNGKGGGEKNLGYLEAEKRGRDKEAKMG